MNTQSDRGAAPRRRMTRDRIAHELGSAVTVVRGYLRMLAEGRAGTLSRAQADFVREATGQVDRMCRLMAQLQCGEDGRPELEPTDLADLVRRALDAARPVLEERLLVVEAELEADLPAFLLDAAGFEHVMMNLLLNAAKFAPESSRVRIRLDLRESERGVCAHLSVVDEGPGIPPEEVEKVFLPYVRGAAADGIPGQGLGLSICKEIVEAHGGTIEVVPAPRGAHVHVTLPFEEGKTRD